VTPPTATAGGTTSAYLGPHVDLTADSLAASATTTKADANAHVFLLGVGAIGGGGAIIASYTTQTTSAYQAPGGVIHLGSGDASLTATANANTAEANGARVPVTAVGVTVLEITSQAGGTTEASVAGELHAGTLELSATSTNTATPTSTSVSVGAASGSGQITVAAVSAITNALVKSGADVHLSG